MTKFRKKFDESKKKIEEIKKKTMCTGTCGGSKTSLNTIVHENVKVYCMNQYVELFFEIFLKFFQKLPSAYIFYKLYKSKFVISYRY